MKSNPVRTVLEWVLITSLLASVYFFLSYFNRSREARGLEQAWKQAVFQTETKGATLNNLGRDCQEYAKTHPDLARVIEAMRPSAPPEATKK